jgi:cold shock CspA family protein
MHEEPESGRICAWFQHRGFGWLTPAGDESDVFVHVRDVKGRQAPLVGARVTFVRGPGRNGRECAQQVMIVGGGVQ